MPFTIFNWQDGTAGGTPLNGANLRSLETRLSDYTDSAVAASTTTWYSGHSFTAPADYAPTTTSNFVIGAYTVPTFATGQTAALYKVRYRLTGSGTCTLKIRINGSDATGFTGLACTTTQQSIAPGNITLSAGDEITLCGTGTASTPLGLAVSIEILNVAQ